MLFLTLETPRKYSADLVSIALVNNVVFLDTANYKTSTLQKLPIHERRRYYSLK